MTPAEYKSGGQHLVIHYSFSATHFGNIMIAATPKGICTSAFYEQEAKSFAALKVQFPKAVFIQKTD